MTHKIFCDKCGKIITSVAIYPDGEDTKTPFPIVKLSGENWLCTTESRLFTKERLLCMAKLIENKEFEEFAKMDCDSFGFFCRECGKNYCAHCWQDITPIYDDYFYDYSLATCPCGHRQKIDD